MNCTRTLAKAGPVLVLLALSTGCVGGIRSTTTPRTTTDMLLVSTAAERAVQKYEADGLSGKRVFIDDSKFDSVDKKYVVSALRQHLAKANVTLASKADPATEEDPSGAQILLQIRSASVGIWDGEFTLGGRPERRDSRALPAQAQRGPPGGVLAETPKPSAGRRAAFPRRQVQGPWTAGGGRAGSQASRPAREGDARPTSKAPGP